MLVKDAIGKHLVALIMTAGCGVCLYVIHRLCRAGEACIIHPLRSMVCMYLRIYGSVFSLNQNQSMGGPGSSQGGNVLAAEFQYRIRLFKIYTCICTKPVPVPPPPRKRGLS